jgi:hypothetical protein
LLLLQEKFIFVLILLPAAMYKITINTVIVLFFTTISFFASAQTIPVWGWAKSHTGNKEDRCVDIAADSRNGVYSYGLFKSDTLHVGSQNLLGTGGTDIFLIKYDSLGNLQWAKSFGNGGVNNPAHITADRSGHIVITGSFTGTINFGGNILTSTGGTDVYVVRIRPNGNIVWARQFSGLLNDSGGPVATDEQSNIYTTGSFTSSTLTIGTTALAPPGAIRIYYCGIDSSGNNLWAKSTSSAANCSMYDIEVLKAGTIIMAGNLESGGTLSFAPDGSGALSSIYHNTFFVKISPAGNFVSQTISGGTGVRFFGRGMAISKKQWVLEAGYDTYLSTNPPTARVSLSDTTFFIPERSKSTTRLFPNGPVTSFDVTADNQQRVTVLAQNINNNQYGPGLTHYSANAADAVLWMLDSALTPKELFATSYRPGFSQNFIKIAKDTVAGTLYIAGNISSFTPGGSYTIGTNVLPHGSVEDGCIVQVRRIYPGPPMQVFAGNDTAICKNKSAVIGSAGGASGGIPPYTYSWSPVTGLANPAAASTTATPSATVIYTLTVTDAVGSTVSDGVTVVVRSSPATPSINVSGSSNICFGDTTTLICSLPGSGSYYYDWYRDGVFVQRIIDNTNFRIGLPGQYTVTVTDDAVLCASPQSAAVTITGTTSSITPGGSVAVCPGDSIILTAAGGDTYLWSTGATTSSIAVKTAGTYTVQATAGSCAGAVSAPVTVTMSTRPNIGADTIVYQNCYGDSTNLLSLYNTAGLTAIWNTATPAAAPPGIYRLIVSNSANCSDTAFATVKLEVANWTGAVSSDWHTAGNWNINKVPSAVTHVIISNGAPNNCVISSANGIAASLQLRNGAVLTTANNMQVVVAGNCAVLPPN